MRVSLCNLPMENMDWARIFDTWKSTKNQRALPLELDDDLMHYVENLNNFSTSFYCIYFFNTMRHHIIFIFNTKQPISSFFFWWSVAKKVWKFEWSVIILKCMCTLYTWTLVWRSAACHHCKSHVLLSLPFSLGLLVATCCHPSHFKPLRGYKPHHLQSCFLDWNSSKLACK